MNVLTVCCLIALFAISSAGPARAASASASDAENWPQFGRDVAHTGDNVAQTAITRSNVSKLKLRWFQRTLGVRRAEPVVVNGTVYSVDNGGTIRALDERTGVLRWSYLVLPAGQIRATPAVVDGLLYVGTMGLGVSVEGTGVGGTMYALDALTGHLRWRYQEPNANATFSGSPLVANGNLYNGEGAKYEFADWCDGGRQIVAFPAAGTDAPYALDLTVPPALGADIWTPPAMDAAGDVYVGTGNRCSVSGADSETLANPNSEAVLKLHPVISADGRVSSLRIVWRFSAGSDLADNDMMGPVVVGDVILAGSKNGTLYAIDAATGALQWQRKLGISILASPASDGKSVYATVDYVASPTCRASSVCGAVVALDMHGNLRWAIPTHRSELYPHSGAFNSPDISNGVVYVAYDRGISAIDGDSAAVLWRYQTQADIFSRASIVQGGLFVGDLVDRLYCFTVNGA